MFFLFVIVSLVSRGPQLLSLLISCMITKWDWIQQLCQQERRNLRFIQTQGSRHNSKHTRNNLDQAVTKLINGQDTQKTILQCNRKLRSSILTNDQLEEDRTYSNLIKGIPRTDQVQTDSLIRDKVLLSKEILQMVMPWPELRLALTIQPDGITTTKPSPTVTSLEHSLKNLIQSEEDYLKLISICMA